MVHKVTRSIHKLVCQFATVQVLGCDYIYFDRCYSSMFPVHNMYEWIFEIVPVGRE